MFNHKTASEEVHRLHDTGVMCKFIDEDEQSDWHYITQDSGAMIELAIRNGMDVLQMTKLNLCEVVYLKGDQARSHYEKYDDHNHDRYEATRVAIYHALINQAT